MKVNKLIAVPVLALAAGIGLAGCSGSGGSSPYNQGMAWEASQEQADGGAVLINMDARLPHHLHEHRGVDHVVNTLGLLETVGEGQRLALGLIASAMPSCDNPSRRLRPLGALNVLSR